MICRHQSQPESVSYTHLDVYKRQVRKVGNSYSGANVSGNVGFVGADGNPISGRPGGGYLAGGAPAPVIQSLANPDGSQWTSGDNAIMAANIRDGIDKYRGTSRDARNDPMNQPMTKAKRSAMVQMEMCIRDSVRIQRSSESEWPGNARFLCAYSNARNPDESWRHGAQTRSAHGASGKCFAGA